MNIKPMLARLQSAMGTNAIERMMLLPPASHRQNAIAASVNLVVGYNSSPHSQTALDLTLWIAHQTRLATQKQVTVHVVYVAEEHAQRHHCPTSPVFDISGFYNEKPLQQSAQIAFQSVASSSPWEIAIQPRITSPDLFEQADLILWQAKSLAAEWRGSLVTHLRFGDIAQELRAVVESEDAALLFLGCNSANHPIVQQLGTDFPCAVLGMDFATGKTLACVH